MGSIADVTQPTPALDFSTFDTDVRVQDDLFRHVNGAWIERTPIPDDKPLTGSFMVLRDAAEEAVRDIITGMDRSAAPDGSDEAKIADLYASFLDTDADRGRRRAAARARCSPGSTPSPRCPS